MFAELSDHAKSLHAELKSFMAAHHYPNEKALLAHADGAERWAPQPLLKELQAKAKGARLVEPHSITVPAEQGVPNNFEYAHLCERSGVRSWHRKSSTAIGAGRRQHGIARAYGTAEQKEHWLKPLLDGRIRSCFAMTEPRVASSDATNIETAIKRDGDHYVVNGRKWWITGASRPHCKVAIVMGKSDPGAPPSTSSNR